MASNKEMAKALADLSKSVKPIQDDIVMLKQYRSTQIGTDPLTSVGLQHSCTVANDSPLPNKKCKTENGEDNSDVDMDNLKDTDIVTLPEEAATFLEAALGSKLENRAKAKAQSTPDSQWIWCAKIDLVVMVNFPPAARTADRAASRLQQFWLVAVNLLIFILEKAEELELPKEVIGSIQIALQLMGNVNFHRTTARRQALLTQLNPNLRQLFSLGAENWLGE